MQEMLGKQGRFPSANLLCLVFFLYLCRTNTVHKTSVSLLFSMGRHMEVALCFIELSLCLTLMLNLQ